MSITNTGNQAIRTTSFHSTGGAHSAEVSHAPVGDGNLNDQPFTASNASGPASTGPGALVAGLKSFGKLMAAPALAVAGKISERREASETKRTTEGARAAFTEMRALAERNHLRDVLGHAGPDSILNETIQASGADGGQPISTLMENYRQALASDSKGHTFTHATPEEVQTWVAMGEKICHHLDSNPDGGHPAVMTFQGTKVEVPANLDTMRAVAWYLTAQAMKDNQSSERPALNVASGTFVLKDPNNAIMKFFAGSDKVYGRYSSHFNDGRADSGTDLKPATAREGFTKPMLGTFKGQGMQNGIEDFTKKFPGNGGTMLFERLKADSASQTGGEELFLKFESVGMPDALGDSFKTHGDVGAEKATKRQALGRCFGHSFNFLGIPGIKEHKHADMANRGEHTNKFFDKKELKDLGKLFVDNDVIEKRGIRTGKNAAKDVSHMPVYEIQAELEKIFDGATDLDTINTTLKLQNKIDDGDSAGINRQGAEVHLNPSASFHNKQFDRL